jgi:serine/threonine protein kinase
MTQQEFFTRYTYKPITDKLGGGAFGTVFKAYDETLGKYIAIKVAEQKQIGDRILSLADEFNALKNIQDHKNIAKYDVFYTFEQPTGIYDFALMQYYPDGNLSQLIKKGNLTKEQKENLALQLLNGINFLHQNQVVHRDLKPSNILIQKHDLTQEYIPKITDFGLSKKANTDKNTHFTNSFAAGTYAYSSPEQLRGETLRFNTDLWAYGAIVYEIFTGKTMFNIVKTGTGSSAMDLNAILNQILNSDINVKIKELPSDWQSVAAACLERDAQKRVKTANELLQILNKEEKTVILPTKQTEETILEQVIPKTSPIKPKPKIPYKYIAIATLLFIVPFAIYFAIRKPSSTPIIKPITIDKIKDTFPENDTTKIVIPTIAVNDWQKDFKEQFQKIRKNEDDPANSISKYNVLLSNIPKNAHIERKQISDRIDKLNEKIKYEKDVAYKVEQKRKEEIEESLAWQNAIEANTITSYQNYLTNYTNGEHAFIANKKLAELKVFNHTEYNKHLQWSKKMVSVGGCEKCKKEPKCREDVLIRLNLALKFDPNGTEAIELIKCLK